MTASRLLVIKQPDPDKRDTRFGEVSKNTSSTLTVGDLTVKVSSTTDYTTITGGKVVNSKLADIKVGSKIIAVGAVTTTTLTATDVHLVP